VSTAGAGSGTVTGNGINCGASCSATLPAGTSVTLTAAAANGSAFAGWSGCDSTSGASCSLTLGSDRSVQATFNSSSGTNYVLTVAKAGSGSGTVTGTGIDCGATCSATLTSGTAVTLTAAAASGSTFVSWSGCDSTSVTTCTLTLGANRTVTATFNPAINHSYALTVSKAGAGVGTVSGTGINCGSTCNEILPSGTAVSLTATAASGSTFTGWSGCDSASGTTCTLTLTSARSVQATFGVASTSYTLTVSKAGAGSGTVTGNGINCGSTCSASLAAGTAVSLTATAASGSSFANWSGCDSVVGAVCNLTLSSNRSVSATFNAGGGSVTLRPAYNNGGLYSSESTGPENTVYPNQSIMPIGCDYEYFTQPGPPYNVLVCALTLIYFDVTSLAGHTVVSAQLELQVLGADMGQIPEPWDLFQVTDAWSHSTVDWKIASNLHALLLGTFSAPTGTGVVNINVTSAVASWVSNSSTNHGFAINLDQTPVPLPTFTSDDRFYFAGLDGAGQSAPLLVIQYQ